MTTSIPRFSLAVSLLALSLSSLASVASAQDEPNCSEPTTQMDMNKCAGLDYEKADKELNAQYQTLRKVLGERDADADESSKGAVNALVAAQRAWVSFRDVNCDLAGFQARGGSMEPMLVSSCLADMSRKRTGELKTLAEGF